MELEQSAFDRLIADNPWLTDASIQQWRKVIEAYLVHASKQEAIGANSPHLESDRLRQLHDYLQNTDADIAYGKLRHIIDCWEAIAHASKPEAVDEPGKCSICDCDIPDGNKWCLECVATTDNHVFNKQESVDETLSPAVIANYRALIQGSKEANGQHHFFAAMADTLLDFIESLHPAAKEIDAPQVAMTRRDILRDLIDDVWNAATESETVPDTVWADKLIDAWRDKWHGTKFDITVTDAPQVSGEVKSSVNE